MRGLSSFSEERESCYLLHFMPDDQGRPTTEELETYSATLQQLIDEARALHTAVTDELRRLRRSNHPASTAVLEHRAIERHVMERRGLERTAAERRKVPR